MALNLFSAFVAAKTEVARQGQAYLRSYFATGLLGKADQCRIYCMPLEAPPIDPDQLRQMILRILEPWQKARLDERMAVDIGYGVRGLARPRSRETTCGSMID